METEPFKIGVEPRVVTPGEPETVMALVVVSVDGTDRGAITPEQCVEMGMRWLAAAIEARRDLALVRALRSLDLDDRTIIGVMQAVKAERTRGG